ncbi:PREDICTED: selenoprotein S-like isoform X2 [Priapulus caudatus]|nr:PREDICTED: selenoprotein S-like isoform X2 [Priapulus caudatus]
MKRKRDEDIYAKKYDAGTAQSRQEAMEAARRRMQEEHAGAAAAWQSQQAEKEMVKRQEKIEDWEKHTQGLGYRSKIKKNDEKASPSQPPPKSTKSKPLRNNDYSPLAGAAGPACQITFGRRGGGSRGGGG